MSQVLLGLAVLVGVVTLVGHGLWVLFAHLFRSISGAPQHERLLHDAGPICCPRCAMPLEQGRCRACDWPAPLASAVKRPVAALDALADRVARYRELGVLDTPMFEKLSRLIVAERQQLIEARQRQVAATTPVAEAEVVVAEVAEEPLTSVIEAAPVPPIATVKEPDTREFVSELPVGARAAAFQARQEAEPIHEPRPSVAVIPAAPRVTWTDWMAAFMEERNIRWGELIGGLLIVCGSIALVVSFWAEIAQRPLLKFLLFNGVTAGLFGLGLYSERRWRLHTTSQGLLTIASLLVPLNFLAIAAFSRSAAERPLVIAGEVISIGLFAALVYVAGRILLWRGATALATGVLVPSLAQLLVRRWAGPAASTEMLAGLAALPVAGYLAVNGWMIHQTSRTKLGEIEVNSLLKFLGITSFAVALPLGLLLVNTQAPLQTLHRLPLVACVLGVVPLAAGLLLWKRLTEPTLANLRVAGTSVGVAGAALSLGGLVLGWPNPAMLLPAALLEFAVFTVIAWWFALPAAHVVAGVCLAISYLLGAHVFNGQLNWNQNDPTGIVEVLVSGATGVLLVPLALMYGAAAFALQRAGRADAPMLAVVAGGAAASSVALTSWFGFGVPGDPLGASWVYLAYAAVCLVLAARTRRETIAWIGAALLAAGIAQVVVYRYGEHWGVTHAWMTALLTYASLCAGIALAARFGRAAVAGSSLDSVLWNATLFSSLLASALLGSLAVSQTALFEAVHWTWLSLVWLTVAWATGWLPVWTLFQAALTVAVVFGIASRLEDYAWFADSRWPWLDPWTWQAVGGGLVALNLGWVAARAVQRRHLAIRSRDSAPRAVALLDLPTVQLDRVVNIGLLVMLLILATYAVAPGTLDELLPRVTSNSSEQTATGGASTRLFEMFAVGHEHAGDWGSWALLGGLFVLVVATAWQERSTTWLLSAVVVAALACPLVASRWESQVAVASALRWSSALFLVVGSLPIWFRGWIATPARRWGWPTEETSFLAQTARSLVLFLGTAPVLVIGLILLVNLLPHVPTVQLAWRDTYPWILAGCLVTVAVALSAMSIERSKDKSLVRSARPNWPWYGSALAMVLGVAPVLGIAVHHVATAVANQPIVGPAASSIFTRMGVVASWTGPILILAAVLVGYAVRERSSTFALAGGLALNLTATCAWLLHQAAPSLDTVAWIRLAQLNAALAAVYTLVWTVVSSRAGRGEKRETLADDLPFRLQVAVAPALLAIVLGCAWVDLIAQPQKLGPQLQQYVMYFELADAPGCTSVLLTVASVLAATWVAGRRVSLAGVSAGLVALAILAAAWAAPRDTGNWLSYNVLMIGHGLIASAILTAAGFERHRRSAAQAPGEELTIQRRSSHSISAFWIDLQRWILLGLAARELFDNKWWSGGAFAASVVLAAAAAWVYQRRRYLHQAAILFNVTGTLLGLELKIIHGPEDFALLNIALLALPVPVWLWIELRRIRFGPPKPWLRAAPVHRIATRLSMAALAVMVGLGLYSDAMQAGAFDPADGLNWIALAAVAVAAGACLWDAAMLDSIGGLYFLGLIACGMVVDQFDLPPKWLLWTGNIVVASYAVATSYLWNRRRQLAAVGSRLKIPRTLDGELAHLGWLVPANLLLIGCVVVLTGLVELIEPETRLRILASQATLAQVISLALLAQGDRRRGLQTLTLQVGAVGAAMFGWAWLEVGSTLTLLHALVVLGTAMAAVATLYGLGLVKLLGETSDWLPAARRVTPRISVICALAIGAALSVEIFEFSEYGAVEIAWPAIAMVAATFAGLAAAALAAAVLPGRDPLNLSERGRTLYVYAAEIALALLFVHIRLTMPWMFSGFLQRYWPIVVMAIAFAGVGLAEFFRRRRQMVLAEPIENTGALLPVLPVLGFWGLDSRVDYSLLLLSASFLYGGLSIARRSFGFGILAALAANGGLWYFLNRQSDFGFLAHPQLWLIPPALCVLVAAYLNRRQLSETQMTAVRYITSMMIYVSSTADIFLNGVAEAPWLPLVLAGLSIIGMLAGILLRVRAFLFLGSSFLGLALFTIIWHAAVDLEQTWIWYAVVVAAGIVILAVFAVFEKKRQEMLGLLENLKQWDA
jgi:hypothetical protein